MWLRRRGALLRLASWRAWEVTLLLLDVTRADALTGQHARGRMVSPPEFERHWERWLRLRAEPDTAARTLFVGRDRARPVLTGLLTGPAGRPVRGGLRR